MSDRIGANTERISSPALRQAEKEIGAVIARYEAEIARTGKVVLHHRKSEVDEVVVRLTTEAPTVTTSLLAMVRRASQGDVAVAGQLGAFFARSEDENTRAAGQGGAGTGGTHH